MRFWDFFFGAVRRFDLFFAASPPNSSRSKAFLKREKRDFFAFFSPMAAEPALPFAPLRVLRGTATKVVENELEHTVEATGEYGESGDADPTPVRFLLAFDSGCGWAPNDDALAIASHSALDPGDVDRFATISRGEKLARESGYCGFWLRAVSFRYPTGTNDNRIEISLGDPIGQQPVFLLRAIECFRDGWPPSLVGAHAVRAFHALFGYPPAEDEWFPIDRSWVIRIKPCRDFP
jgi:hypothetical protein